MKIAIVYKSVTGNTKLLSRIIKDEVASDNLVYYGEPNDVVDADLYFIGSWTDKGMCDPSIKTYLEQLKGKRIAYFQTAGFGGSKEYYDSLFARVKETIDSSNTIETPFFCQGKMPEGVRERYVDLITEHPGDKQLQVSLDNFEAARTHPDKQDLDNVKHWVETILDND